jgi:hypothetical protein
MVPLRNFDRDVSLPSATRQGASSFHLGQP